ncbi:MAG: DUF937 domain-containing protein [Pseudomonadota bacterium]
MALMDLIVSQLGQQGIGHLGQQLGVGEGDVQKALPGALAMLTGGLETNARREGGAESLLSALDRDHDGSILDDIGGLLGGGQAQSQGDGILKHVLGDRRETAANALSQTSGLGTGQAGDLLKMLAPVVMGALGRQKREQGLGATDLASMLGGERQQMERDLPQEQSMLTRILDADGDGSAVDDIARMGMSVLGGLFGGRR